MFTLLQEKEKRIPIGVFHDSALTALHKDQPMFRNIKTLQNRTRLEIILYMYK